MFLRWTNFYMECNNYIHKERKGWKADKAGN